MTLFRIVGISFVCAFYLMHFNWSHAVAALCYIAIAITDWLDGYLARTWHQTSKFGAFLDPVADKLLVSSVLVMVVGHCMTDWLWIPAAIIIGREITVSALREWMAEVGRRTHVAVINVAKIKTLALNVAMPFLLWYHPHLSFFMVWYPAWLDQAVLQLSLGLLIIASILTLWSMVVYLKIAWPDLMALDKE